MVKRSLALFDFDGTMISGDSIVPYIKRAFKHGFVPYYTVPKIIFSAIAGYFNLVSDSVAKGWSLRF